MLSASEIEVNRSPFLRTRARADHVSPSPTDPASPAALFDLLGRRWALRILWELREAPLTFQALQTRCDSMSTSVLTQRLGELRAADLVRKEPDGSYALSEQGTTLLDRLRWIDDWTRQWAAALGGSRSPDDPTKRSGS